MPEEILHDGTLLSVEHIELGEKDGAAVLKSMPDISWFLYFSMMQAARKEIRQYGVGHEGIGSYGRGYDYGFRTAWEDVHP